jgi:hypothetical protein
MSNSHDREAILDAFALEPAHDRDTLERYLRQYPELAEDLIDLSSELRLANAPTTPPVGPVPDPGLVAAWEELLACKPQAAACGESVNPFASFKGTAFAKLAKALNVPREFLTPFRDGLVMASSIPQAFTRRFAEATKVHVESARSYFARAEPETPALAFKSDVKPSHRGQMTFRELVQATEMTDEQRQILLRDCDADGRD